jgi:ABC-type phosphate transport system auxiliary subunit
MRYHTGGHGRAAHEHSPQTSTTRAQLIVRADQLAAFTPDQREMIRALVGELLQEIARAKDLATETGQLVLAGLQEINTDLAALRLALLKKGVIDSAAIDAAKAETQAAFAVEQAVHPELRAAAEQLQQLKRELGL